jgi:hypothetical protein
VSRSMGTGAGPTPALWQAAPQKGWSPKKGTMKVGLPGGGEGGRGGRRSEEGVRE